MPDRFDPYYRWLGIPAEEQPPNHYRLLGIKVLEENADVIEAAADRQMGHLRTYQTGEHSALSQKLLNEVAAARVCLLNPEKKAEYDAALRKQLEARRKVIPTAKPLEPEPPLDSALVRLGETAGAGIARVQAARNRRQRPVVVGAVIGAASRMSGWSWRSSLAENRMARSSLTGSSRKRCSVSPMVRTVRPSISARPST